MLVATPTYAADTAARLAEICGDTFALMPQGDERDRYWLMAAYIHDELLADDEFHEGCLPEEVADDREEAAFEAGYEKAHEGVLASLVELGTGTTGERRTALREAYAAARGTESRQAMDAMIASYINAREASE